MNNYRRIGYQRDNRLVELLDEWGALDTDQIQQLLFPSIRVAQRRLSILTEQGKIKRNTQTCPYFYYTKKVTSPLERININWVRIWIDNNCKSWERTIFNYDTLICTVQNTVAKTEKQYIISDKKFRLQGDNTIMISDEFVNNIREELKCAK